MRSLVSSKLVFHFKLNVFSMKFRMRLLYITKLYYLTFSVVIFKGKSRQKKWTFIN